MKLDFLSDEDGDILIQNGDFVIEDAVTQHAKLLIDLGQGEIRQFPNAGVGIINYIGSKIDENDLYQAIFEELAKDNIDLLDLTVTQNSNDNITIDIKVK